MVTGETTPTQQNADTDNTAEEKIEYEIGVEETNNLREWDWYHKEAANETEAKEKAIAQAREDGYNNPRVYDISGPHTAFDPATISNDIEQKILSEINRRIE